MKYCHAIKGKKIVEVANDGYVAVKGYAFYKYDIISGKCARYAKVQDKVNTFLSRCSLIRRLTRAEITKYYRLKNGTELCIARKGIFRKVADDKNFKKCFNVIRGSRPMYLCEDTNGKVYFGEYFQNMEKKAVHIYESADSGKSWNVVYTFPEGNINHIHGIYMDPYTQKMWIATGDRENECIIGYTEDGFRTIKQVFRGGQEYRTCILFFYKDFIVFATDSQYQQNYIKKFDRNTLEITTLQEVQGPVIKGAQCGDLSVISTDVEPSDVNKDKKAYVWYSTDGMEWKVLHSAEKDWWHPTLFQFGVFDLPNYDCEDTDTIYVTGKALKKCDGKTMEFSKY